MPNQKIVQGTRAAALKAVSYVKSVPINALRPVSHGNDHAIRAEHGISVEMRLDLFVGVGGDLPTESVPGLVIKEKDGPAPVIVGMTPELEQVLYDIGRNASLLEAGLGVMRDR
jgi:hypothetical protein